MLACSSLLHPFQMAFFIMLVNLIACFLLAKFIRRKILSNVIILLLIIASFLFFGAKTLVDQARFEVTPSIGYQFSGGGRGIVARHSTDRKD